MRIEHTFNCFCLQIKTSNVWPNTHLNPHINHLFITFIHLIFLPCLNFHYLLFLNEKNTLNYSIQIDMCPSCFLALAVKNGNNDRRQMRTRVIYIYLYLLTTRMNIWLQNVLNSEKYKKWTKNSGNHVRNSDERKNTVNSSKDEKKMICRRQR